MFSHNSLCWKWSQDDVGRFRGMIFTGNLGDLGCRYLRDSAGYIKQPTDLCWGSLIFHLWKPVVFLVSS